MPRLLIIAAPHSGTKYIAKVLQGQGLSIPHETHIGRDGLVSWHYGVQTDHDPIFGHASMNHRKIFGFILHQVRHPLAFLRSAPILSPAQWEFVFAQELFEPPAIRKAFFANRHIPHVILPVATKLWIAWNRNCEELADITYRIEWIGQHGIGRGFSQKMHSHRLNKRYLHKLAWSHLEYYLDARLMASLKDSMRRYGY